MEKKNGKKKILGETRLSGRASSPLVNEHNVNIAKLYLPTYFLIYFFNIKQYITTTKTCDVLIWDLKLKLVLNTLSNLQGNNLSHSYYVSLMILYIFFWSFTAATSQRRVNYPFIFHSSLQPLVNGESVTLFFQQYFDRWWWHAVT